MDRGFFSSLFDFSFTSFITTKIIKVIYAITLIMIGLTALGFIVAGFADSPALGLLMLVIIAPLVSLFYVIYTRVILEFIIQVFRIGEHLRDQNAMQREAFVTAGWLTPSAPGPTTPVTWSDAPAPPPPAPPAPPTAPPTAPTSQAGPVTTCPNCGTVTAPGAQFCRSCGHKLS